MRDRTSVFIGWGERSEPQHRSDETSTCWGSQAHPNLWDRALGRRRFPKQVGWVEPQAIPIISADEAWSAVENAPSLCPLIESIAHERGLSVAHDTHYDAGNWQFWWWEGAIHRALDVQPYPDGRIEVAHLSTRYPVLPKLLAWARRAIPFFPEMGRADRQLLVRLQSPPMERLRDAIEAGLRVSRVTNRDGTTV